MGWYDAFKKTAVSNVDNRAIGAGAGIGATALGNAFGDFGKTLRQEEVIDREQDLAKKTYDVKKTKADKQNELTDVQIKTANRNFTDAFEVKKQKKIDDSFKRDVSFASNPNDLVTKFGYTEESMKKISPEVIQSQEKYYQDNFNSEAISLSTGGEYKSFAEFKTANPKVVDMSDGATVAKISKYYDDKDRTLEKNIQAAKDLKNERKLTAMQNKIVKAQVPSKKSVFKYTETTDSKIAAQVKTAMGMDTPDYTMTDIKKKEYQNNVAASAIISKKYNLEPSLAIHVAQNKDLYDFTADGKVLLKKQAIKPNEIKDPLGLR